MELMKTPQKITGEEFIEEKIRWEKEDTKRLSLGMRVCRKCNTTIKTLLIYIGIHSINSPCDMNSGEVLAEELEYCPQCEEIPEQEGCVHV